QRRYVDKTARILSSSSLNFLFSAQLSSKSFSLLLTKLSSLAISFLANSPLLSATNLLALSNSVCGVSLNPLAPCHPCSVHPLTIWSATCFITASWQLNDSIRLSCSSPCNCSNSSGMSKIILPFPVLIFISLSPAVLPHNQRLKLTAVIG